MSSSALQKGQRGVWGVIWLFPETFDLSNTKLEERPAIPQGLYQGGERGTVTDVIEGPEAVASETEASTIQPTVSPPRLSPHWRYFM